MEPLTHVSLWIGCIVLAIAALIFGTGAYKARGQRREEFHIVHFLITAMACLAYLGMAMNQGTYDIGDRTVYWARYLDWFITTPLILFSLTRLSGVRATMIAGAIIANQFMIGTGFVATMSTGSQKWVWYIVSCAFMLAIYAILLGPVFNASRRMHHQVHNLFTTAIAIFGTYYLAYPIVWILGEKGFGIYGVPLETFLIMILDIIAKVVYAFVLLRDQEALDKRSELESKYS